MKINKKIIYFDLNNLLQMANIFFVLATLFFYSFNLLPSLVDRATLLIYALIGLQLYLMLLFEKRKTNPFLIIFVFYSIFFYGSRIFTLYFHDFYSYSGVLDRITEASVDDINFSLIYILIANLMIFLGLSNLKKSNVLTASAIQVQDLKQQHLISYILVLIFLTAASLFGLSLGDLGRIGQAIDALFSPSNVILLSFILIFILHGENRPNNVNNYIKYILWMLTLVYLLSMLHLGSRAAFFWMILLSLFSVLSLGIFKIKKIYLYFFIILVVLSFILFPFATHLRALKNAGYDYSLMDELNTFSDNYFSSGNSSIDMISLVPAFDRIAYLDFSVDLIKNAEEYKSVVNIPAGFKSSVDGLTPGFDIFDAPKMANALQAIYRNDSTALSRLGSSGYQSDQFGVYGEMYVLFYGWPSLPFFFIFSFIFSEVYSRLQARNDFKSTVWRAFILTLFSGWLNSFGFDWFVIYGILAAISIKFILMLCFSTLRLTLIGGRKMSRPIVS